MAAAFDIIRRMARKPRADLPDESPAWRLMRLSKAAKHNDPRLVELVKACRRGDVAEVRRLLKSGLSPNQIAPGDAALDTAVTAAVYARQAHVIGVLAHAKADLDTTPSSYTPLVTASGWRDLEMVLALIDGGANVNQPDQAGVTPLQAAVRGGPGQTPLPDSDPLPVVDALLKAGADPDFVPRRQTGHPSVMTPLRWAAYEGSRQMIDLFVAAGSKEKKLDALRLCGAAHRGTLDELKELVDRGVNVNQRDATHATPLVAASEAGHEQVVAFLLERGANPNLHAGFRNDGQSALIAAAVSGRLKIVKMLVRAGADHAYKMRVAPNSRIRFSALDFARHVESEHRREGADAKKHRSVVLFLESLCSGN
jgi:ankyrin repeat protein